MRPAAAAPGQVPATPGDGAGALRRSLEAGRQLHEHKGPYYEKWRRAMRRAFSKRRRRKGG